jgi:hypothetical protein
MRKPFVRTLVAVAAAVVATALGSGVASATVITPGTWTVSPSGAIAATAGTTTLVGPNATLTCASSSVTGTAVGTATGSPATLASLPAPNGAKFNNCTGPFGFTFTVTQNGTWLLQGITYDNVAGVTSGRISSVNARLSGPACTATVTGSVNATYTNSTKKLQTTTSNLTVTAVSGCLGLLSVGQHPTFNGTYTASTGQTITAVP